MLDIPVMYVPSFYGDIRLEVSRGNPDETLLIAEKLNNTEKLALAKLTEMAVKKGWRSSDLLMEEGNYVMSVSMLKLQKVLSKMLKPGRAVITAVKFSGGKMIEVFDDEAAPRPPALEPDGIKGAGTHASPKHRDTSAALNKEEKKEKAEAGVAVAAPTRGCPAPDFVKAEIKARGVLEVFLSPEQLEDFRKYNRFVTASSTTGTRYMVTSRHAKDSLSQYQRSLYDLDTGHPCCVHDYSVPAAEEMLALHVLLQTGYEGYLRHLEN